jgi:hypothetical protein
MNYHDVLDYVRGITSETDVNEILEFAARANETDPLLSTLPILIYVYRGGHADKLVKAAVAVRQTPGSIKELLDTYRTCLSCESQDEFRASFHELLKQVAEDLGDEAVARAVAEDIRCANYPSFKGDEEGR